MSCIWTLLFLLHVHAVPALGQEALSGVGSREPLDNAFPIDLKLAKTYFDAARRLADRDGGRLWGQSLAGPLLFVDPRSRFVVANQADAEGKLKMTESVFVGTLPGSIPVANTATRWAGTHWSMMLWPLPEDDADRSVMLMHESWHRIQADLGLPSTDPANAHLDTFPGRYWLQLEWRALARALLSLDDAQRKAIADALHFRRLRRDKFKGAAANENTLDLHEGLAEYSGVKLAGLSEADQRKYLLKHLDAYPEQLHTFVRSFAYLSGPAYGLLLDQHAQGWQRRIKPGQDLGEALAAAINLKLSPEPEATTKERASSYAGAKLWATEVERDLARGKKIAAFRQLLIDGPVLILPLDKRQMSFNPSILVPIEGVGTVYPTLTLVSSWGKLEVRKAALITSDSKKAVVAAPATAEGMTLRGDGWELNLTSGWSAVPGERKGDWKVMKE